MSPDRDYGDKSECTYMQDISVDDMRYEKLETGYTQVYNL